MSLTILYESSGFDFVALLLHGIQMNGISNAFGRVNVEDCKIHTFSYFRAER